MPFIFILFNILLVYCGFSCVVTFLGSFLSDFTLLYKKSWELN
uniref:Uncharacterized protein n=1 Tax=Arundo donax TaxID=35708 RepID=A0A0A9Q8W6_ARUDO